MFDFLMKSQGEWRISCEIEVILGQSIFIMTYLIIYILHNMDCYLYCEIHNDLYYESEYYLYILIISLIIMRYSSIFIKRYPIF